MKDFAKSIRTMNSNKEEIIKKKKEAGARAFAKQVGNSKVGNYDAFLSNAKTFLRDWEVGVDAFEKDGNKGRIEMIMRSAEAKYKELEKYKDQCYDAYKESSDMLQGYKELYRKAQRAASKL